MHTAFYETGIGDSYDSLSYLKASRFLGIENEKDYYAHIFANAWQARRMCEYYPILMSDTWGNVSMELLDQNLVTAIAPYLTKLKKLYKEAQILANIYGGATIIRYIDDGNNFNEPINFKKIKSVSYSKVFDKWDVYPLTIQFYEDVYNPKYYQYFTQAFDQNTLTQGLIHNSRVIRFRGKYLPPELMKRNHFWEASLLYDFIEPYARYYIALNRTLESIRSADIPVVSIENLSEKDDIVREQQKEIQVQVAQNRGIVKEKETVDIDFISRQFKGIQQLLEIAKQEVIASSDLTIPQMYKEFPGGMQSTGKSELMTEALALKNRQENQWGHLIRDDLKILMSMFKNTNNYEWKWNNAYFNTPVEEAELRYKTAQTDKIYYEMQSLSNEEIRESHFTNKYNSEITLKSRNNQE